ncbi:hypothetical protein B4N89_13580 [Embleya scabrispora]|uniref:Helix-turn-helix domain-containing protein n=1 Tax=Embleya scabrispora TaxID=159449 RepID=A0A1T3NYU5_9ACTN|nr:helix-turn-helix domain-containing protein [Embleya scabrispora]OPC81830.1 hypothetical protein B4N89_13580 [Embleya scabrispora]
MSYEAVAWAMDDAPTVWTDAHKPDATARFVLAVLAEHADRDGRGARPSGTRIQYRTGYDPTTVRRALRRLESAGLIRPTGTTADGCVVYDLDLSQRRPATDWADLVALRERDRAAAAERQRRSRANRVTGVTPVTVTGVAPVTNPDGMTVTGVTPVTVTGAESVTVTGVTPEQPPSRAQRPHVTGVTPECHGRNAPRTINEPPVEPSSSSEAATAAPQESRDDVEQICRHLADRIAENGSRRPTITARWRTEARLLLDKDGRTVAQVLAAIDWCQADSFWRANVLSMPKLREKYDQLRLKAVEQRDRAAAEAARTAARQPAHQTYADNGVF